MIGVETNLLLEIVNHNVKQQQYVCAGHVCSLLSNIFFLCQTDTILQLRALWILGEICDQLSRLPHPENASTPELRRMIHQCIPSSQRLPNPIELKRGSATIPLSGIDVPFHSSHLRGGIDGYRQFLRNKIRIENIDPDELVGKFIPNVVGKPFSVERSYVEEVARTTQSLPLLQMLEAGKAAKPRTLFLKFVLIKLHSRLNYRILEC